MKTQFCMDDLIKVAKRENNNKRNYLYVNPFQGKHVPVSPSLSLGLFSLLADKIQQKYAGESLLVIGFAETATAIGSAIAFQASNVKYYMNTTREHIEGAEYLYFTESHSHAAEQKLAADDLEDILSKIDRVVFAEDEVTTGNTIEKLIKAMKERFCRLKINFGIISILNSMSEERIRELEGKNISCIYLYKIPEKYNVEKIDEYTYEPLKTEIAPGYRKRPEVLQIGEYWNCRRVCSVDTIRKRCLEFVKNAMKGLSIPEGAEDILILGTEEFMFPGMLLGQAVEREYPCMKVKFHGTTRSPIEVSRDEDYPLHQREPLESLYEEKRRTFLYNLAHYDKAVIVTDAPQVNEAGLNSLVGALETYGNMNILLIRWEDFF